MFMNLVLLTTVFNNFLGQKVSAETAILSVIFSQTSLNGSRLESAVKCTERHINNSSIFPGNLSLVVERPVMLIDDFNDPTNFQLLEQMSNFRKQRRTLSVVGPSSDVHIQLIQPFISKTAVPHISPLADRDALNNNLRFPWLIKMVNTLKFTQAQAILATVRSIGWSSIGIMMEDNTSYRKLSQDIWVESGEFQIKVHVVAKFRRADVEGALSSLKRSGQRVFVILCGHRSARPVLEGAEARGMTSPGWMWVMAPDVMNLLRENTDSSFAVPGRFGGLLGLRLAANPKVIRHEVVQKCGPFSVATLKYVESILAVKDGLQSALMGFNLSKNTFYNETTKSKFMDRLLRHIVSPSSLEQTPRTFDEKHRMTTFSASFEILNLQNGTWTPLGLAAGGEARLDRAKLVFMGGSRECPDHVADLRGRNFKVVTFSSPPFVVVDSEKMMRVPESFSGLSFELLRDVAGEANFSFEVRSLPSGVFGAVDSYSGHWSGLVGELTVGKADIVVAPLTITDERSKVIDFTSSYHQTDLKYMYDARAASGLLATSGSFLLPFTGQLWGVIAASVLLFACFLSLVAHLSPYGAHGHYFQSEDADRAATRQERRRSSVASLMIPSKASMLSRRQLSVNSCTNTSNLNAAAVAHSRDDDGGLRRWSKGGSPAEDDDDIDEVNESRAKRQMSFSNALYFACAGLLWQSPESVPRAPSSRVAAAVWYMVGVIVVASYTANMVAFVDTDWQSHHLQHVKELLGQAAVRIGTVRSSSVHSYLLASNHPIAEKLYESMLQEPDASLLPSLAASEQRWTTGLFSLVWEGSTLDHRAAIAEDCRLKTVSLGFGEAFYAFALQKDSLFTEQLSAHIQKRKENGFIEELNRKYFMRPSACGRLEGEDDFAPLSFSSLSGVFAMLLFAAAASAIALVAEWCVAAFLDVNRLESSRPASINRAFAVRWARLHRELRSCFRVMGGWNGEDCSERSRVQPGQWERYNSSAAASSLRPGQSLSATCLDEATDDGKEAWIRVQDETE